MAGCTPLAPLPLGALLFGGAAEPQKRVLQLAAPRMGCGGALEARRGARAIKDCIDPAFGSVEQAEGAIAMQGLEARHSVFFRCIDGEMRPQFMRQLQAAGREIDHDHPCVRSGPNTRQDPCW